MGTQGPPPSETPPIDSNSWDLFHQRLQAAQSALQARFESSSYTNHQILRDRARALAKTPENTARQGIALEVVEFRLAYENYGIETRYIREIIALKEFRRLPGTPAFVLGLIHVRGQILSVIDIKKFFDLPEKGLTDLNKILILRSPQMEIGILADAVLSVRRITAAELEPPLPTLSGSRATFVKGMVRGPVVILDAERMLSDVRVVVDEG